MKSLLVCLACWSMLGLPRLGCATPGLLLDMFTQIYEETGTFPDDKDEYTQLSVVSGHFNACLAVGGRKVGNGGRLELHDCYFTHIDSPELFWLRHVGQGYVTLATPWNRCVGAGRLEGAPVWTGDWCDSGSHHFTMIVRDGTLLFQNRESGAYLTAVAPGQPVSTQRYRPEDTRQVWKVCDPSGRKCWPKPEERVETEEADAELVPIS